MTVLYFADTRFPIERANGAQTMATCRALALRGHDVTLVVRPDTARPPRDPFAFYGSSRPERMTIRTIGLAPGSNLRRMRFLAEAAAAAVGAGGVVMTRDLGLASFLVGAPLAGRTRLVYESHGISDVVSAEMPTLLGRRELAPPASKLARLARREELVWRRAAAYVTITQTLADELRGRFGDRPHVYVVPDGGPAPAAVLESPPPGGPAVAGYAGHLYPWKGVDVLLHALAQLPSVSGLIIGGHPAERDFDRVRALTDRLGLQTRVSLTGQVPPAEVAERLATASILVLPNTPSAISARYTSPLKMFEYLAMGRPIVASDLPAIREVLTHEQTALLVPAGDATALAAAIQRLIDDPALAGRIAAAAFALAPRFTWDTRAAHLEPALRAAAA